MAGRRRQITISDGLLTRWLWDLHVFGALLGFTPCSLSCIHSIINCLLVVNFLFLFIRIKLLILISNTPFVLIKGSLLLGLVRLDLLNLVFVVLQLLC